MKEQRRRAREVAEEQKNHADHGRELPFYRFYGMRRYVAEWKEKLSLFLGRACVIIMLSAFFLIVATTVVAFFLYFPELWIKLLVALLVACFVLVRLTRGPRMRRKFCRKLKRLCTETKSRLQIRGGFVRSPKGISGREDIRIESGTCVYYLHYIGTKKYGVSLYIEPDGRLKRVQKPLNNKFTMIFNFQPKITYYPVKMPVPEHGSKRVLCGFVVDPICQSMYYKQKDGGYEATGSGGEHFGVVAFSTKGLFEAIQTDSQRPKKEIQY